MSVEAISLIPAKSFWALRHHLVQQRRCELLHYLQKSTHYHVNFGWSYKDRQRCQGCRCHSLSCGTAGSCNGGSIDGPYQWIAQISKQTGSGISYENSQPYLACSSDSSEGFCSKIETTCKTINVARTCGSSPKKVALRINAAGPSQEFNNQVHCHEGGDNWQPKTSDLHELANEFLGI